MSSWYPTPNATMNNFSFPVEQNQEFAVMPGTTIEKQLHGSMLSADCSWLLQGFLVTAGLLGVAVYSQHKIPNWVLGWIAAIGYICFSLSLDFVISKAKRGGSTPFSFEPAC